MCLLHTYNRELLLKPGMTATAEIETGKVNNALLVPNPALRFIPADYIVKRRRRPRPAADWGAFGGGGRGMLKPHDLKLGSTNGLFTVVLSATSSPRQAGDRQ